MEVIAIQALFKNLIHFEAVIWMGMYSGWVCEYEGINVCCDSLHAFIFTAEIWIDLLMMVGGVGERQQT